MIRKKLLSTLLVAGMVFVSLTGCGGREGAADSAPAAAPAADAAADTAAEPAADDAAADTAADAGADTAADAGSAAGFEKGSAIGVSLPWLGTQNWKEAETMFKDQLVEAGYEPIVQAADQKVPQQQ